VSFFTTRKELSFAGPRERHGGKSTQLALQMMLVENISFRCLL
jgi:hypothetical protein